MKVKGKQLILVRGIPGQGKTSYVKKHMPEYHHFEADMYFEDENGNYIFDPRKLKQAHSWCKAKTKEAMENGDIVVVSNTFTQHWEMKDYFDMAKELGYITIVLRMQNFYENTHGVPETVVTKMKERFESYCGERFVK